MRKEKNMPVFAFFLRFRILTSSVSIFHIFHLIEYTLFHFVQFNPLNYISNTNNLSQFQFLLIPK